MQPVTIDELFQHSEEGLTAESHGSLVKPEALPLLDRLNQELGVRGEITGGPRTAKHPLEQGKDVPGTGSHTLDSAIDIKYPGIDAIRLRDAIEKIDVNNEIGGLGLYNDNGTMRAHLDFRPRKPDGSRAQWGQIIDTQGTRNTTLEDVLQFGVAASPQVSTTEVLQEATVARTTLQTDRDNGLPVDDPVEKSMTFLDYLAYPGRRTHGEIAQLMGRMGLTRSGLTEEDIPDELTGNEMLKVIFNFDAQEYQQDALAIEPFNPDPTENIFIEGLKYISQFPGAYLKFEKGLQAEMLADAIDPLTLGGMGLFTKIRNALGMRKFNDEIVKAKKLAEKIEAKSQGTDFESVGEKWRAIVDKAGTETGRHNIQQKAERLIENDPGFFEKIKHLYRGRGLTDEEVVATAIIAEEKGAAIMQWLQKIGPDALHDPALQKKFVDMMSDFATWDAPVNRSVGNTGRALEATQEELTAVRRTFTKQFTELFGKGIVDPVSAAKQVMQFDSMADLAILGKQLSRPGWGQMYNELLINGLLSGPKTLMGLNPLGNTFAYMHHLTNRQLGALFGNGAIPPGEAGRMALASLQAVPAAFGVFWKTMKSGKVELNKMVKGGAVRLDTKNFAAITAENFPNAPEWMVPGINWLGAAFRLPSRTMMAQDEFLKAIFYQGELAAQAGRVAAGTPGFEKMSRSAQAALRRSTLRDMEVNPDKYFQAHRAAKHTALGNTFTAPLGQGGEAMVKAVNSSPLLKTIFPFVRTPINIMKRLGNDLSFGMSPKMRAALRSHDPAVVAEAKGRIAAASLLATTAIGMSFSGLVIGGRGPLDRKVAQGQEKLQGRKQGSLAFDSNGDGHADTFLQFNTRTPVGQFMNMMGSVGEGLNFLSEQGGAGVDDFATEIVLALADIMEEAPFMDGMANLFELQRAFEQGGTEGAMKHIRETAPTYIVPMFSSFRRQVRQAVDPTKRVPGPFDLVEGKWEALANQIPGWSDNVQPVHDMFGNEETYPIGMTPAMVGNNAWSRMAGLFIPGLNMVDVKESVSPKELKVAEWMFNQNYVPPPPARKYKGIEIPHNLYEEWKQVAGTGMYRGVQLLDTMVDRLGDVVAEDDQEPVPQTSGDPITQGLVSFKEEYRQQYQEALEILLDEPQWAEIVAEVEAREDSVDPVEQTTTNKAQRQTIPLF